VLKDLLEGKPLRHPIHPMLVHFPIGFLVLSFLLDLVSLGFPEVPGLLRGSFYAMLLGCARLRRLLRHSPRSSWQGHRYQAHDFESNGRGNLRH